MQCRPLQFSVKEDDTLSEVFVGTVKNSFSHGESLGNTLC